MLTQHLAAWRTRAGWTLERVAEALGVNHDTVSQWERGVVSMSLDRLDELARLYRAEHPFELLLPPDEREHGPKLAEAVAILRALSVQDATAWLLIGRRLAGLSDPARDARHKGP